MKNTIFLTGLPRSGTTLCCNILNHSSNVLALHEPLTPQTLSGTADGALKDIAHFVCTTRQKVLKEGVAPARQKNGVIPENPVGDSVDASGLRQVDVNLGEIVVDDLDTNFTLVVKHNALFTALLPSLTYPCFAVIRNPLSVLASWNSVNLPVNQGRLPAGERYDSNLSLRLDSLTDRVSRQLTILEWFLTRFSQYTPTKNILRYETFINEPSSVSFSMGLSAGVIKQYQSRNTSYSNQLLENLYYRLLTTDADIWQYYTKDDVAQLYEEVSL